MSTYKNQTFLQKIFFTTLASTTSTLRGTDFLGTQEDSSIENQQVNDE